MLAYNNADNTALIGSSGGVVAVLAAMRSHIAVAEVQEEGCNALLNLAFDNAVNTALIGSSGGVPAVLSAMQGFIDVVEVQEQACRSLSVFAADLTVAQLIGTSGGILALRWTMRKFAHHQAISRCAAHVLELISPLVSGTLANASIRRDISTTWNLLSIGVAF
jgi:hypothetical protein